MKQLVEYLIKSLSDHPEKALVEESESEGTTRFRVTVADEDKGKVIGKQGKVIKAVRALVAAAGSKSGRRTAVDVD